MQITWVRSKLKAKPHTIRVRARIVEASVTEARNNDIDVTDVVFGSSFGDPKIDVFAWGTP